MGYFVLSCFWLVLFGVAWFCFGLVVVRIWFRCGLVLVDSSWICLVFGLFFMWFDLGDGGGRRQACGVIRTVIGDQNTTVFLFGSGWVAFRMFFSWVWSIDTLLPVSRPSPPPAPPPPSPPPCTAPSFFPSIRLTVRRRFWEGVGRPGAYWGR